MRRNIRDTGKKMQRNPQNLNIRTEFFRRKRVYKKALKQKRRTYRNKVVAELDDLAQKNPNAYWNLLDDLKNETYSDKELPSQIPMSEWKNHFENLHSSNHWQTQELDITDNNVGTFSELDFRITPSETLKAINRLKNKKAARHDGILGEMLKAGKHILVPYLTKLFNTIFLSIIPDRMEQRNCFSNPQKGPET